MIGTSGSLTMASHHALHPDPDLTLIKPLRHIHPYSNAKLTVCAIILTTQLSKRKRKMLPSWLIYIGQISTLPGVLSLSEKAFLYWSEGMSVCVGFWKSILLSYIILHIPGLRHHWETTRCTKSPKACLDHALPRARHCPSSLQPSTATGIIKRPVR